MNAMAAINAYSDVSLETDVMTADSHKLVRMLFDGALLAIRQAQGEMLQQLTEAKGKSISRAIAIIGEGLQASLDLNVGGEIARNLFDLYGYMIKRLVQANQANDASMLDEVARLLSELREAWEAIRSQVVASQPAEGSRATIDARA